MVKGNYFWFWWYTCGYRGSCLSSSKAISSWHLPGNLYKERLPKRYWFSRRVFYQHLENSLGKPVDVEAIEACFLKHRKRSILRYHCGKALQKLSVWKKNQLKLAIVSNSRKAELMHFFAHHQELMSVFWSYPHPGWCEGQASSEGYQKCLHSWHCQKKKLLHWRIVNRGDGRF